MDNKKYQVFISSTFKDLKDDRLAAMNAVIGLQHVPIGMEGFPAVDEEQMSYIKLLINECDYYILIIKNRYGSVNNEGLSYTELEFDYALEQGKHILAFIYDGDQEGDCDNPDKLSKFIDKIQKNRLTKNWTNKDSLELAVFKSLSKAFASHPRVGWVRSDAVADPTVIIDLEEARKKILALENDLLISQKPIGDILLEKDEIQCLLTITEGIDGINEYIFEGYIISSMKKIGYNGVAAKIALRSLTQQKLISIEQLAGSNLNDDEYSGIGLLPLGWDWLDTNKEKLKLTTQKSTVPATQKSTTPEFDAGDIPF